MFIKKYLQAIVFKTHLLFINTIGLCFGYLKVLFVSLFVLNKWNLAKSEYAYISGYFICIKLVGYLLGSQTEIIIKTQSLRIFTINSIQLILCTICFISYRSVAYFFIIGKLSYINICSLEQIFVKFYISLISYTWSIQELWIFTELLELTSVFLKGYFFSLTD